MDLLESPDDAFLNRVAEACPWATFFHSPIWHDLVATTEPEIQSSPVGFRLDDGTEGYLPLLEKPAKMGGLTRRYESTFQGCYGGIIADGEVDSEVRQRIFQSIQGQRVDRIKLTGNPLTEWSLPSETFELEEDFTQIIDIDRSWDDIVSDFARGHRSSYNKARREGVQVRHTRDPEDFERYFKAYEASLERWGEDASSAYPWSFFETVQSFAEQHPDHIRLWLAEIDDNLASGALIFYWNRHVSYWHGAAHAEYFDQRPNNLLHPRIIQDAIERTTVGEDNFEVYDFNPSGGHDGVVQFKSRFGTDRVSFQRGTHRNDLMDKVQDFVSLFGDD